MINGYDDEKSLLRRMREVKRKNIVCLHNSKLEREVKQAFFSMFTRDKIVDNSGKADLPPDFYSNELGIMADMIQVNDYETSYVNANGVTKYLNPLKEEESKAYRKFLQEREIEEKPGDLVLVAANPSGATYTKYVDGFKRIYNEHAGKKSVYLSNFPDCKKVGILICDDSHLYLQRIDGRICAAHCPFKDFEFLKTIKDSDMDFLVWYFSNKFAYLKDGSPVKLHPEIIIIDVQQISMSNATIYDKNTLVCAESDDGEFEPRVMIVRKQKNGD